MPRNRMRRGVHNWVVWHCSCCVFGSLVRNVKHVKNCEQVIKQQW